jgi:hypothetical protein
VWLRVCLLESLVTGLDAMDLHGMVCMRMYVYDTPPARHDTNILHGLCRHLRTYVCVDVRVNVVADTCMAPLDTRNPHGIGVYMLFIELYTSVYVHASWHLSPK